jgi:hypothetical protein
VNELLANARWMDGLVWFVVTGFAWLAYETVYLGAPLSAGLLIQVVVIWGLAGSGYAILSGWFANRAAAGKNGDSEKK